MKIQLISQFYDPEPTLKGEVFAQGLAERGHEVRVLTGFPNYPSGRLANGYRLAWHTRENHGKVIVDRVWLYPSHDASVTHRLANYASFAATSSVRTVFDSWRPDVVWVHHPPLSAVSAALIQSTWRGLPVVLEIQDLWPDSLSTTGMVSSDRVLGLVARGMRYSYREAAAVVCISDGFRKSIRKSGIDSRQIHVIPNWADERRLKPGSGDDQWAAENVNEGDFNIAFTGNMGPAQALESVLAAVQIATRTIPSLRLHLVGDGLAERALQAEARRSGIDNAIFHGRQPMERVAALLTRVDAGLVHLSDSPLFAITVPSKTQAYMCLGIPIIMAVRGDAAELVDRAGAGLLASPQDPDSIARAIVAMEGMGKSGRSALGEAGSAYYRKHLSVSAGLTAYERVFESVVNRPGSHVA